MLNLNKNQKYLLACSHGPDSMALFYMLKEEGYNFAVAHVNYHHREESNLETLFMQLTTGQIQPPQNVGGANINLQQPGVPQGQQFGAPMSQQFGGQMGQPMGIPQGRYMGAPMGMPMNQPQGQQFGGPMNQPMGMPQDQPTGAPQEQQNTDTKIQQGDMGNGNA